jgi:hypothetical protein
VRDIPGMNPGARLGIWIGFHGWLIGVAILAGSNGEFRLLGEALLVGVPLSSALCLATLRIVDGARDRRSFGRRLAGSVFLGVGILLLAINHWLAPLITDHETLRRTMEELGGQYATSDLVPAAFLAAAAVLLLRA